MVEKEFVRVSISDLIPYDNNPRKNDNAVPDVVESIKQCGDLDPIEIDENNVILAGHTRLMALMEQGFTETDVIRYTGLTEEQKKKYRILSNKTGEKALWDFDALAEELEGLDFDDYDFFDPVLAEIMYKWFCVDGGAIYDCFAGGSVRGIVADKLGYKYTGIDIRQGQVDANYENASDLGLTPVWYCDDSKNADKYIQDNSVDMIFSCPPYADLEVYSDNPNDISNMDYDDFCKAYKEIIDVACRKLKDNRFAAFVVGDVRDKKGAYRDFVEYTKKCFLDNGLKTYNELILVEQIGTGALRAKKQFGSLRKVIKTHQNVLVFYKGDIKKIKDNYTEISVDDLGDEEVIK